jgi:hypothetical protein
MQRPIAAGLQAQVNGIAEQIGPALSAVAATLLVILGALVIAYPELLSWVVGIALVLAGVGLLASVVVAAVRPNA